MHYTKPPITEAIIDLQVELPPETGLQNLRDLHREVALDYPTPEDMMMLQSAWQFGASITATTNQTIAGLRFLSKDKKQICQARLDGFSFSRLAPYATWQSFHAEAYRLWEVYRKKVQPKYVQRIAVRYINRLDLPQVSNQPLDFKDYLRTIPEIAPGLPQALSSYLMQLEIPQEDLKTMLIINQALLPPARENHVSVLLDIGMFREVNLLSTDTTFWDQLEELRQQKNNVFEACITDKTREVIR
jgi:uncharacterized protein (TIGR04255 family)